MSVGRRSLILIVILWIVCTAFNITKAAHIDDPVYLYVAQQIQDHPLHPYAGTLNWSDVEGRTSTISQPPLLSYLFAAGLLLLPDSEFVPHCIIALFSLGVIVFFFRLLLLFGIKQPLYATALLILGPAFIPSQNLMTDVPALFFFLLFFYLLMSATDATPRRFVWAGVVSAVACLIKYISAILPPIFVFVALVRQRRLGKLVALLPLCVILLWMLFTYLDYGAVHVISKISLPHWNVLHRRACDYVVCLGGIASFSLLYVPLLLNDRRALRIVAALVCIGGLLYPVDFLPTSLTILQQKLLIVFFWINGLLTLSATLVLLCRLCSGLSWRDFLHSPQCILCCWILGNFLFVVIFARFIAVRHLLPVLPAIIIVLERSWASVAGRGTYWRRITLLISTALGLSLSLSDWTYADMYRRMAVQIRERLGDDASVVTVGHWGWQWYSEKVGMKTYDQDLTVLKPGEFVVIPFNIHRQQLRPEQMAHLEEVETIRVAPSPSNWIRSMGNKPSGGFYASWRMVGPWRFSTAPLEVFAIYKVQEAPIRRPMTWTLVP